MPLLVRTVQHVIVDRDGLDLTALLITIVAAFATVVAVVIAVLALRVADDTRDDLAQERRFDFELTLLREIADLITEGSNYSWPKVVVRASMLDLEELPWIGYATHLRPDSDIDDKHLALYHAAVAGRTGEESHVDNEPMLEEVRTAIARRLKGRPSVAPRKWLFKRK